MLELYTFVTLGVFIGIAVGSFLNVVILRSTRPTRGSKRSHCDSCQKTLSPVELIPIASFVLQKGRCRSCGAVLSFQYPLVESGTAAAFGVTVWFLLPVGAPVLPSLAVVVPALVAISTAIVIFVADLRFQIIPNGAVLLLLAVGAYGTIVRAMHSSAESIPAIFTTIGYDAGVALSATLLLALLWFFSHGRGMGFGDVKLIPATSLILGYPTSIAAFLFSFWLGGIAGILLLLFRVKTLQSRIPFGPFILLGGLFAYFLSPFFLSSFLAFPIW